MDLLSVAGNGSATKISQSLKDQNNHIQFSFLMGILLRVTGCPLNQTIKKLEEGHEVWLLQPRIHPLNPSNNFTIEDIGRFDVPAGKEFRNIPHLKSILTNL